MSLQDRRTALHIAARYGHVKVVEVLIRSGADIHAFDVVSFHVLILISLSEYWLDKDIHKFTEMVTHNTFCFIIILTSACSWRVGIFCGLHSHVS